MGTALRLTAKNQVTLKKEFFAAFGHYCRRQNPCQQTA